MGTSGDNVSKGHRSQPEGFPLIKYRKIQASKTIMIAIKFNTANRIYNP